MLRNCPQHGSTCKTYVPPSGKPESTLAIIGEAPGEVEIERGEPFVGPAGELLWNELGKLGVTRDDCWVYNAVPCIDLKKTKTPDSAKIKKWRPHLLDSLKNTFASVVLLLGRVAIAAVLGRAVSDVRIKDENASIVHLDLGGNHKVLCVLSIHPSAILRSGGSPELLNMLRTSLSRAVDAVRGEITLSEWYPGHVICENILDLQDIETAVHAGSEFVVDVECVDDKPVWIGIYVPLKSGKAYGIPIGEWYTGHKAFSDQEVADLLKKIFGISGKRIICHNANYDMRILRKHGFIGKDHYVTDDTLLLAHTLDPRRSGILGLKDLGRSLFAIQPYWTKVRSVMGKPGGITNLPVEEIAEYNGRDCVLTYMVFAKLMRELVTDEQLLRLYLHLVMPVNRILLDIGENGLPVDMDVINSMLASITKQKNELKAKLDSFASINWNSSAQVAELLYDKLGLPILRLTETGEARSTDEDTLRQLQGMHPVVDLLLEYRETSKRLETIVRLMDAIEEDGRIHPSFNLAGTVSGRSSSTPNVQNFERGPGIRDIVKSSPGYKLVEADLSQIELRWMAVLYDEPTLRKSIIGGEDIHLKTAMLAFEKEADQVTSEERTLGKTVNFSSGYGAGPTKIAGVLRRGGVTKEAAARILGIEPQPGEEDPVLQLSRRLHHAFHTQFPRVRVAWGEIAGKLRTQGYVRSAFGRKFIVSNFDSLPDAQKGHISREAANFIVQSSAADTMWLCLVDIAKVASRLGAKLINVVHDSVLAEVPESAVEEFVTAVHSIMHNPRFGEFGISMPVPIRAGIKVGESWGHLEEVNVSMETTATTTMLNTLADYVRLYVKNRWCVVPVEQATKLPAIPWADVSFREIPEAEIRAWELGGYGLGIVTGRASGLVVIDVDSDKGRESMDTLGLDSPVKVRTGGGGLHLYFKYPDTASKVPNRIGIWPGIDIRGDGGFVVAPPTRHQSGNLYTFECPIEAITPENLPSIPATILPDIVQNEPPKIPDYYPTLTKTLPPGAADGIAEVLAPHWQEGIRHDLSLGLAGMLAKRGYTVDGAYAVIERLAEITGDEEARDRIKTLETTYTRVVNGESIVADSRVIDIIGQEDFNKICELIGTVRTIAGIRCMALGELVSSKIYQPEWVIQGLLPKQGMIQIAGHPGVGKTTLALQLAAQVAVGKPFLGEWEVPKPRRVLYLQADNPPGMIHDLVADLLKREPAAAWEVYMVNELEPIHIDHDSGFEKVAELCRVYKPDLLIFDTVRDFHTADERDPNAAAAVVMQMDKLRHRYGVSVIFLNHLSKNLGFRRAAIEAHMGTMRWVQKADSALLLTGLDDADDDLVRLEFAKARWMTRIAPRTLRRVGRWFVLPS
jgi:uracil-DNA glycosylase family 4